MQIYKAPINEMEFVLGAFGFDEIAAFPKNEDYDQETTLAILREAGKFASNELLPLNRSGDREGLTFDPDTHSVVMPKGFKEAYRSVIEHGMIGLALPSEYGGGGAPTVIGSMLAEIVMATNKSFSMCTGLTHGLVDAVFHHGSDEIKERFLPKLIDGTWAGTMCLTEPQCGTDLGLLRTKAIPHGDHHLLTGTKIWITFGDHDLTENIVHLVLARLPDAPEGIRGISLFLVPKFNEDGERNPVYCTGLEHKLGIHASPTCVISMEDAKGWLVGEPHKGMRAMFTMMNTARLSVGLEGVALAEISYQTALAFAKDRRQGRSLNPERQEQDHSADTIMVHPDVRRMLLNIKSTNEAMRALAYWVGIELEKSKNHPDATVREDADDLVALLTPVVKSYLTERGFQNISEAMQVMGGAGYTQDWPVEQYLRDSRIALIYEGTNHIQALDLVGRKLPMGGGRLIRKYIMLISSFAASNGESEHLAEFLPALTSQVNRLGELTMGLATRGMNDPEDVAAIASSYLNLMALVTLSYVWCRQVDHAKTLGEKVLAQKTNTARFFFHHVLPESEAYAARVVAGKADMMACDVDSF